MNRFARIGQALSTARRAVVNRVTGRNRGAASSAASTATDS